MSMPTLFAASQIVVPSGTVSACPSMLSVTVRTSGGAVIATFAA